MIERLTARWIGVAITIVVAVLTVWLGATGQLDLFVNPGSAVFTVTMAVIACALVAVALIIAPAGGDHHDDEHGDHDHIHVHVDDPGDADADPARLLPSPRRGSLVAGRAALVVIVGALLVIPPTALTARSAQSRAPTGATSLGTENTSELVGEDPATFTIKDWSALLGEGDRSAVIGKQARVSGYLLGEGSTDDTFFLARLSVTCCAVDARPVAVPIHLANWRQRFGENQWLRIEGTFADQASGEPVAITPSRVIRIAEPAQPYVF